MANQTKKSTLIRTLVRFIPVEIFSFLTAIQEAGMIHYP
jgi:hypothetical protein